jgi:hypothetical protein
MILPALLRGSRIKAQSPASRALFHFLLFIKRDSEKRKMKKRVQLGVLLLTQLSLGQTAQPKLPCAYSGAILRDDNGKIITFTSPEMKSHATRKVDVSVTFMGHLDFKATFMYQVLVGPTGNVICIKRITGLPVADAEVEKAVRQWKFKSVDKNGKPVASMGVMEFYLCNISCGKEGTRYSIVD